MDPVFIICWIAVITVIVISGRKHDKADAEWARAAEKLGFSCKDSSLSELRIAGRLHGFAVVIAAEGDGEGYSIRLEIDGGGRIDPSLELRAEGFWTGFKKKMGGENVQVQDASFDARVYLKGEESRILAIMNHQARKAVLDFLDQRNGWVSAGMVQATLPVSSQSDGIVDAVHAAVHVAEHLALPTEATALALAENALIDPIPEVRLKNLECWSARLCASSRQAQSAVLAGSYPPREETARAAQTAPGAWCRAGVAGETARATRDALLSKDRRLRLLGAVVVGGEEGFVSLKQIAEQDSSPAGLSGRAIVALMTKFPWERVAPLVAAALTSKREPVLEAAVWAIGEARDAQLLGPVCGLAKGASAKLAIAIAETLGALANPEAEPALLELLAHDSEEVRVAAAGALGQAGTIHAVEPLLLVKNGRGPRDLKKAALDAERAIRCRLGDVEAGRLSLAEHQEGSGALSIGAQGEDSRSPDERKSLACSTRRMRTKPNRRIETPAQESSMRLAMAASGECSRSRG